MQSLRRSPSTDESSGRDSEESDWDDDDDDNDDNDHTGHVISSPTGLKYNITHVSPKTRNVARSLFNEGRTEASPQISLELCGIKEEDTEENGIFYAFQMHERVPCSVRIGSRSSTRFSNPRCECPAARYKNERPCKHIIWLFDHIAKQALFDHDPDSELTLTDTGYAQELGEDLFHQISDMRLDVLADSLYCDISPPNYDIAPPSMARVREAREMVAAVVGIQPRELDSYRIDLEETSYTSNSNTLIHRGDVEATLFSLLLASHSLATWVRHELNPSDPAIDPFRLLQRRVSRIIHELDTYSSSLTNPATSASRRDQGKDLEGPRDVAWAATQIQHCVRRIEKIVSRGASPLAPWERASAARALVGILKAVASHSVESHHGSTLDDRNLYMRLVGNHDTGFVYSALDMLVDQSQFIEELEHVMDLLGRFGAPASYAAHMRALITRMRSFKSVDSGSLIAAAAAGGGGGGSVGRAAGGSGGGGSVGTGSKRSVSGSGQDRGGGSKRAR
ncbi:hypothetical protein B0T17DRAFT_537961 [Bombardia bombarda]|uniref:SWIM-type domain-containing protein n=1 Tax=Bombardia bombarda TaxID=252184 RepID=A0AA40BYS9_9PEZI|nr:hypothetical protein B0T17DRAFT_537961 [Bombardia bombarda]